ncbi:MAG: NAD(P)H-dependent oxidoreductase [Novosphingobium sp.]|nr:NAD(P)H-dependent oxidoreductase [Novosphingobium sp.]
MDQTPHSRRILVIDAHPDPDPAHFDHALAAAYCEGAAAHDVTVLKLANLDFPFLRRPSDWMEGAPPPAIAATQEQIRAAEHIVLIYPLWLGDVPALLKAFLEQVMRPGFALAYRKSGLPKKLLKGRTAHLVVTMGMPALFYRLVYGAHSVKSLERNILKFVGIRPIARSIIGGVEDAETRGEWLQRMRDAGRDGR